VTAYLVNRTGDVNSLNRIKQIRYYMTRLNVDTCINLPVLSLICSFNVALRTVLLPPSDGKISKNIRRVFVSWSFHSSSSIQAGKEPECVKLGYLHVS
jgi:hypothetical protein